MIGGWFWLGWELKNDPLPGFDIAAFISSASHGATGHLEFWRWLLAAEEHLSGFGSYRFLSHALEELGLPLEPCASVSSLPPLPGPVSSLVLSSLGLGDTRGHGFSTRKVGSSGDWAEGIRRWWRVGEEAAIERLGNFLELLAKGDFEVGIHWLVQQTYGASQLWGCFRTNTSVPEPLTWKPPDRAESASSAVRRTPRSSRHIFALERSQPGMSTGRPGRAAGRERIRRSFNTQATDTRLMDDLEQAKSSFDRVIMGAFKEKPTWDQSLFSFFGLPTRCFHNFRFESPFRKDTKRNGPGQMPPFCGVSFGGTWPTGSFGSSLPYQRPHCVRSTRSKSGLGLQVTWRSGRKASRAFRWSMRPCDSFGRWAGCPTIWGMWLHRCSSNTWTSTGSMAWTLRCKRLKTVSFARYGHFWYSFTDHAYLRIFLTRLFGFKPPQRRSFDIKTRVKQVLCMNIFPLGVVWLDLGGCRCGHQQLHVAERWPLGAGPLGVRAASGERGQELWSERRLREALVAVLGRVPHGVHPPPLGTAVGAEESLELHWAHY